MIRLWGRSPRGERVHASAPAGRWQSTTMLSSIRLDGSTACMATGRCLMPEFRRDWLYD